ncbi:polysaccharide export protein [Brucella melitensis]|nr:polysaccharide export protein [Brucella melitensis]
MMATTIQSKRKSHIIFLALGFAAMTLAGCASYRPAPPAFHEALNQPYLLDAGDRVRITVFEQPSLSNITVSINPAISPFL